ncbi:hypothetical protein GCM10007424_17990 [Flavobacterium suaedae]|uniref:Lipocalin-like domain-containing protein n=2 Tax=Flavobacterium suaedae TaxID=1767027 RepID=A0ABQ1JY94_9FLAO|nr:hypothetical protein GCM10007424_17990 [Flavobacterium suaedae]
MSVTFTACSGDDGVEDRYTGVPKGKIAPVADRHKLLTGYPEVENGSIDEGSQVWWVIEKSIVDYYCGEESEKIDNAQENFYYAFKNDGVIYYKEGVNGTEYSHFQWEWKDADKNAIMVSGEEFELRELNANSVVYASYQEAEDCYAIIWEQFRK